VEELVTFQAKASETGPGGVHCEDLEYIGGVKELEIAWGGVRCEDRISLIYLYNRISKSYPHCQRDQNHTINDETKNVSREKKHKHVSKKEHKNVSANTKMLIPRWNHFLSTKTEVVWYFNQAKNLSHKEEENFQKKKKNRWNHVHKDQGIFNQGKLIEKKIEAEQIEEEALARDRFGLTGPEVVATLKNSERMCIKEFREDFI
jgi:hypothetical protein